MKNYYILFACMFLVAAQSCTISRQRCQQLYPPVIINSTDTFMLVKETLLHDTTYIAPDNAEFEITLEADTNNMVQVVASKSVAGKRSTINYRTRRSNNSLHAMFNCHCDSLAIYHAFKSIDTSLLIANTQTEIHQVDVPAQFTWWQLFKVSYGGYAMLLIALYVALRMGWWALKTYTKIQLPFTGLF